MMKVMSVAKLKKAVKAVKAEKQPCILVVDTFDNSIVAKLPRNHDVTKYDKFRYMFYMIGGEINEADRQRSVAAGA